MSFPHLNAYKGPRGNHQPAEVGYPESGKCDDEGKKKTVEKYRALLCDGDGGF